MSRRIIVDRSVAPYYDDYDSSKQYTHLLAMPGRVAQAREITQLQSVVKDIIKSIGDSILKDGNIIEGCQVIVNSTKTAVTVTAGKIYMNGMVLPVEESTVAITGSGTEYIGAKLIDYLITEDEDSTLRDPALGYDNYNQSGCHRIQSEISIVVNDQSAAIISTLLDGGLYVEKYAPEYDVMTQTLARRTYDESGSYIVEGLNVRSEGVDSSTYHTVIEAGKAYVLGYELKIPTARRLLSNKSTSYSPVTAYRTYVTGTAYYSLYSDHPYVKNIIKVVGVKEVTEQHSISSPTARVPLNQGSVLRVLSVTQGSTSYTIGTSATTGDCYLVQSGSTYYLQWNGTENYPTLGSNFNVTYEYYKEYVQDTDYELVIRDGGNSIHWIGDTPKTNTIFSIEMNQYLARKDIVYMDRYGAIELIEGVPAEDGKAVTPEAPLNTLTLAVIDNPPNGSVVASSTSEAIHVNNIGLTRFTMNDIQSMLNRIKTIEYDQAVLSLNDEARNDTVNNKRGIFTDPLIDISRLDFYFNKNSSGVIIDPLKPIADLALDLSSNIAYLPVVTHTNSAVYDSANSTTKKYNRLLTLNTTGERVVLSQLNATKSFLVNPYSVFPQLPEVTVTPSVDSWIDDNIIEVPVSLQDSSVISLSTRIIDNRSNYQINNSNYSSRSTSSVSDTAIGTKTTTYSSDNIVSERATTYIRRRTLTVEGHDFPSNLDNIKGYFDGIQVQLTPVSPTIAGTLSGTVKSNANGYLKATFTIPENILTGTREVTLKSDITRDGYISEGFTLYIARGITRDIRRTVTTLTTVLLQRTTTTNIEAVYVDPVGQTFVLDRMTMLKGIDLYFESKPVSDAPVICEIRGVSNGTITSQVYAHTSLSPDSVNVSATGSLATRFTFEDPVLLEENKEYSFVVRSNSDDYTIWVAEIGGTDVISGSVVLKNAYSTGVMLSSSNNSTWVSHQTTDIKFRLIEDVYTNTSIAKFTSLTVPEFSRIYLSVDSAIPTGTTVSWSYSTDGVSFRSITPYSILNINSLYTTLQFKAVLDRVDDVNLSPMIALDTIEATTSEYDDEGYYVSKNISNLTSYTNVKVILDTYEPSGTGISVKVSNDNGTTLTNTTKSDTFTELSYGWRECTYTATLSSSTSCRIFIGLVSNSAALTPSFRRLRVIFSA